MALRHTELTDLSEINQLRELNRMLKGLIDGFNRGGNLVVEEPRAGDTTRFGGSSSQGPIDGSVRLRAVSTDPSGGGRKKLQFFNGKEWEDK